MALHGLHYIELITNTPFYSERLRSCLQAGLESTEAERVPT